MKTLVTLLFVSFALAACTPSKKDDIVPAPQQQDQTKTDTTGVQ